MVIFPFLLAFASTASAPTKSVPPDMQGVWGRHGRCGVATDRLVVAQDSARLGAGPFQPVTFDPETQSVNWTEEGVVDNFVRGKSSDVIVHNVQGFDMPGEEGYARCTAGLHRVAWPATGLSPNEAKAAAFRLYGEVRRLNAQCVAIGGGVSGAPECDEGTARESMLEHLGYCIDYPHRERLVRCDKARR